LSIFTDRLEGSVPAVAGNHYREAHRERS
jgi:hypothetical protein